MGDLRALPKGHLHYHLEPCMRPSTLSRLCKKYGIDAAANPVMAVPREYSSFDDFEDTVFATCFDTIRKPEDLMGIVLDMAEDAAADGVVYIEPAFGAGGIFAERWPMASERAVWDVALMAGKVAEERYGVTVRWMVPAVRTLGPESAMKTARLAADMAAAGEPVVSFGLHASEGAKLSGDGPFPPEPFEDAFRVALGAGLVATPHAGEFIGPDSCRGAVERLGAERLQHGVRAIEDPATMELLRSKNVCCDICPTSNVLLKVVPKLSQHSLPAFVKAGIPCTINVDDSLLFGKTIVEEFTTARETLGLTDEQLQACARASITHSGPLLRAKRGISDEAVPKLEKYLKAIEGWAAVKANGESHKRKHSAL